MLSVKILYGMRFDEISDDGRLWAVRYDGMSDNILYETFHNWVDIDWLKDFFVANLSDLRSSFHITDIDAAIFDSISDAVQLQCLILDITKETDLDLIFRPLHNSRVSEMLLGKEKLKGFRQNGHSSWLRLYAIKLQPQSYIITGGAIKLTRSMQEREHTLNELMNLEKVRNFLIEQGVTDLDGMDDYMLNN